MKEFCNKCKEKSIKKGGFLVFKCVVCQKKGGNFLNGQTLICYSCAEQLGICPFCGKEEFGEKR